MKKVSVLLNTTNLAFFLLVWGGYSVLGDDESDRKIAPSDAIIIEVFGEKELSMECRVQASGTITYHLLGNIEVAGKTTAEVAALLREKLGKDFLVNPQVTINVKEYRQRTVSVMGQVMKQGTVRLPFEYKMDILEAITEAGGLTPLANKSRIELNRKGKTTKYTLDQLRKEVDPAKKVWLETSDLIYVHESIW